MLKYCKALVNLAITVAIIAATIFLLPKFLLFFSPFLVGWIVAMIAAPFVQFFEKKLKIKRKMGSAVVIIVVIGLVILVLYLLGAKLIEEGIAFVAALPSMVESIRGEFVQIGKNLTIVYDRFPPNMQETLQTIWSEASHSVGTIMGDIGSPTIAAVGNFAKSLPSVIIAVIMSLLFSYFYVADRSIVTNFLRKVIPKSVRDTFLVIKNSLAKGIGGYFKAQFKIEIGMYILLVIGLSILKVDYSLLIALGIAILDFIPFFGTGTIMVPWAIIEILGTDYTMAVGLLIIWGVGQLIRQIIQPKMVGDSIGVAPIPTIILLYIGFKVGGVLAMIFAVPVGLALYTMYQEGIFHTSITSIKLLLAGINHFRKFQRCDLEILQKEDTEEQEEGK